MPPHAERRAFSFPAAATPGMILVNEEIAGGRVVPPSAGGGRSGVVSRGRWWRVDSPAVPAAGARRRAGVLRSSSAHSTQSAAVERFEGTSAVLLIWLMVLVIRSRGRALTTEIVLRPEHYMQTVAQLAIYVYWSVYWHPIRDAAT